MKIGWFGPKENSLRYSVATKSFGELIEVSDIQDLNQSSDLQAILFSEKSYSAVFEELSYKTETLLLAGAVDGLLREGASFVPKCSYVEVFMNRFSELPDYIDNSKGVLIVGDYEVARPAFLTLFKLGFKQFFILGDKSSSYFNDRLKKVFFDLELNIVQVEDLINLSGITSVLIHGVNDRDQVYAEWELSYLNFLGRPGLLIDFLKDGFLSQVVIETEDEGLILVDPSEIEELSMKWWMRKTGQSPVTKNGT